MKAKTLYFFTFLLFITSCNSQKKLNEKINTKVDKNYLESRKTFQGKLNNAEYEEVRKIIETELNTSVPKNNSILINYYQKGTNCLEYGLNEKNALGIIDNCISISSRISKEYNSNDFFVFSSSALNKERLESNSHFILDSGFFEKNIFTLKENCRAFFILKPNGEFMKHFGSDYYSEVKAFLEKN